MLRSLIRFFDPEYDRRCVHDTFNCHVCGILFTVCSDGWCHQKTGYVANRCCSQECARFWYLAHNLEV